jgi:hypothetical protein
MRASVGNKPDWDWDLCVLLVVLQFTPSPSGSHGSPLVYWIGLCPTPCSDTSLIENQVQPQFSHH